MGNLKFKESDKMIGEEAKVDEKMLSHTLAQTQPMAKSKRVMQSLTERIIRRKLILQWRSSLKSKVNNKKLLSIGMFTYSARRSTKKKDLQLHSVIRDFKRFEQEKQILHNRINIMHQKQVKNFNKVKGIEDQLQRIKIAQSNRKEDKKQIQKQLGEFMLEEAEKKKETIRRIKQEKKRIDSSKNYYIEFKEQFGRRAKSESKVNYQKILTNRQNDLALKQKRRKEVNESHEMGKSRATLYKTKRLRDLKASRTQKILQQIKLNKSSESELQELQKIQKQVLLKYSQSISSLRNSRASIKKLIPLRV